MEFLLPLMKIILFVFLFQIIHFSFLSAQNNYYDAITELGFDESLVKDYSASKKIMIDEPRCAYVNITGISSMPTSKTKDLQAWLEFYDTDDIYFKKRVLLRAQGNSSINWPKKNVAIDFCEDEWIGDETTKLTVGNWVKQDGFHLKAYYIDWLRGVGTVGYKIYDDIVADHESFLERAGLEKGKARCYPDGFPCIVYLNGTFYGIYSWQLKKHRDNMGMDKRVSTHIHLDGAFYTEFWRGEIDWSLFEVRNPKSLVAVGDEFSVLPYDGDNPTELIDETKSGFDPSNELHVFSAQVKKSIVQLSQYYDELYTMHKAKLPAADMRAEFESRFDVCSLIDYYVFSLYTANYDGFGKNWQWFTYDGVKWFVAPYDLDCTFGNIASGTAVCTPEWFYYGKKYQSMPEPGPFYFLTRYYLNDIYSRYASLRDNDVLSADNVFSYIQHWYDSIGDDNYKNEYERWDNCYCNRELILNDGWTTFDDWTNYNHLPVYDPTAVYEAGSKCILSNRIWTSVKQISGVCPYSQLGYRDSLVRLKTWINRKFALEDYLLKYRSFIRGDVNADALIDNLDATTLSYFLLNDIVTLGDKDAADVNEDGLIDIGDQIGLQVLLGPIGDNQ